MDTTEQTDAQEELTTPEEETLEEETQTEDSDYEADLEAERKRGKPDPEIARKAFQERHKKDKKKEGDDDEDDEDKPLTRKDLARIREEARREANADRIQEIAEALADDPKQVPLIIEIHKNRGFPEGMTLKEQLDEAYVLANRKKILSTNKELTRALASKDTVTRKSVDAQRDPQVGTAPKLSAGDAAAYARAGYVFDAKSRFYKKELPNKKHLFKDPKTKRTWVA